MPDAQLQVAQLFAAQDAGQRPLVYRQYRAVHGREFKRVGELGQVLAAFVQRGKPVQVQRGTVEMQQLAVKIGNGYALGEVLDNRVKLGLAVAQRHPRLLLVFDHPQHYLT